MAHNPEKPPRHVGAELVIPVLATGFTLYYFSTIWNSPWTAQVSAFLIGGVLLLCCLLFFVRAAGVLRRGEGTMSLSSLVSYEDVRSGRIGLIASTVAYCWLIDDFGFTLTTFLFLWLSMAILGRFKRLGLITLLSTVMSLGGWAVFIWIFETRFPRGVFEQYMMAVMSNG